METVRAKQTLFFIGLLNRQTVGIPNGNASSRPRLEGIFLVCHGSRCGVDGLRFEAASEHHLRALFLKHQLSTVPFTCPAPPLQILPGHPLQLFLYGRGSRARRG